MEHLNWMHSPERSAKTLPVSTEVREFIGFEHLMSDLDTVVDACQPDEDTRERKGEYRTELLADRR